MISARAFITGIGALLILVGGVFLVLDRLGVFETCAVNTAYYGGFTTESCTQSPVTLIVAIVVMAIGMPVMIGAIIVKGSDD
jgi:hypothetical protein